MGSTVKPWLKFIWPIHKPPREHLLFEIALFVQISLKSIHLRLTTRGKWCSMVYGFKTNHKYGWNTDITRETIGIWWEKTYIWLYIQCRGSKTYVPPMCFDVLGAEWTCLSKMFGNWYGEIKNIRDTSKGNGGRGVCLERSASSCLILMGNPCHSPNLWFQVKIRLPLRESALFRSI